MFKEEIPNDSRILKEVSSRLMGKLKASGVGEDVIFDIHVGFEEALRNAMVHGNKNDPGKTVKVETEIQQDSVIISIEDQGEGFDPEKLPDPTTQENLLREGGRGVYLIRHLMDEVIYEKEGRRVVMRKYFAKARKK